MRSMGEVMAASNRGMTPTEIDEAMRLRPGTAHKTMVSAWRADRDVAAMARAYRHDHNVSSHRLSTPPVVPAVSLRLQDVVERLPKLIVLS